MPRVSLTESILDSLFKKHDEALLKTMNYNQFLDFALGEAVDYFASDLNYQATSVHAHKGLVLLLTSMQKSLMKTFSQWHPDNNIASLTSKEVDKQATTMIELVKCRRIKYYNAESFHSLLGERLKEFGRCLYEEFPHPQFFFKLTYQTHKTPAEYEDVIPNINLSERQIKSYCRGQDLSSILDMDLSTAASTYRLPEEVRSCDFAPRAPSQLILNWQSSEPLLYSELPENKQTEASDNCNRLPIQELQPTTTSTVLSNSIDFSTPNCNEKNPNHGQSSIEVPHAPAGRFRSWLVNSFRSSIALRIIQSHELGKINSSRYRYDPWLSLRISCTSNSGFRVYLPKEAFHVTSEAPQKIRFHGFLVPHKCFTNTASEFLERCHVEIQTMTLKMLARGLHFPDPLDDEIDLNMEQLILPLPSILVHHFNSYVLDQTAFVKSLLFKIPHQLDSDLTAIFACAKAVRDLVLYAEPSSTSKNQSELSLVLESLGRLELSWHPDSPDDRAYVVLNRSHLSNLPFGLPCLKFIGDELPTVFQVPSHVHDNLTGKLFVQASGEILERLRLLWPSQNIRHKHDVLASLIMRRGVWCLPDSNWPFAFFDSDQAFFHAEEDSFRQVYQQGHCFVEFSDSNHSEFE